MTFTKSDLLQIYEAAKIIDYEKVRKLVDADKQEIKNDPSMKDIINWVDIIVDGPFIQELKDTTLEFRGSSNQNIIKTADLKCTPQN